MRKYDVIAFDLDGTLTDPAEGLLNGFEYAFRKVGIEYPNRAWLKKYIGPPLYEEWKREFGFSDEETDRAVLTFREYYNVYGWWDNKVYPGISEMLKRLKAAGLRLVVATSKPENTAKRVLSFFELDGNFDFIGGADGHKNRDKKHEVLTYVLDSAGVSDKSRCILVGDRLFDAEGARACGIDSMAAMWGHGTEEELRSSGFTLYAKTPLEVADILINE